MKKTLWRRRFLMGLAVVLTLGGLLFVLRGSIAQSGEYCAINDTWCIKLFKKATTGTTDRSRGDERVKTIHGQKYTIKNQEPEKTLFIPTRTEAEWYSFVCATRNAAAAGIDCRTESELGTNRFPTKEGRRLDKSVCNRGSRSKLTGEWVPGECVITNNVVHVNICNRERTTNYGGCIKIWECQNDLTWADKTSSYAGQDSWCDNKDPDQGGTGVGILYKTGYNHKGLNDYDHK